MDRRGDRAERPCDPGAQRARHAARGIRALGGGPLGGRSARAAAEERLERARPHRGGARAGGRAARAEPDSRPACLAVAHGDDVVARTHVVTRDAGDRGARARPGTVPAGLRAGLALDPRAPPRSLLAGVRRLHRCGDRHRLDLHRREGGIPLDRVRDARRGAQPDLPRPAAPRGHRGLALLAPALAPGDARRLGVHHLARPLLRLPARLSVLRSARLRHRHAGEPLVALGPADDSHRPRGRERRAAPRPPRHPGTPRARAGTNGDHRARSGGGGDVDARRRDHERERIGQRLQGLRRRAREAARLGRPRDRTCADDVHRPEHLVGRRTGHRHARVLEPLAEEHLVARRLGAGPGRDPDARPGEQVREAHERPRLRLRPHDERRGPRRPRSSHAGRASRCAASSTIRGRSGSRSTASRTTAGSRHRRRRARPRAASPTSARSARRGR